MEKKNHSLLSPLPSALYLRSSFFSSEILIALVLSCSLHLSFFLFFSFSFQAVISIDTESRRNNSDLVIKLNSVSGSRIKSGLTKVKLFQQDPSNSTPIFIL